MPPHPEDALESPSVQRNREPIFAALRVVLPPAGLVLEIASGTGEHAVHMAGALPGLMWQPTDADPTALRSIAAHRAISALPNLHPPIPLDVTGPWPEGLAADAVVAINMVHIAPWAATHGLMRGAAAVLRPGAPLYLYGPFREEGVRTAPSNEAFDLDLKARDPAWGLRDLADVAGLAERHGLRLTDRMPMPANNLSVVFRRS
jgi:hypothetical protein